MFDASRFDHKSPDRQRTSPKFSSPGLVIDSEGYVFLRGSSSIGLGTRGIGERGDDVPNGSPNNSPNNSMYTGEAQKSSDQIKRERLDDYIKDREELHKTWHARETQRINSEIAARENAKAHMVQVMFEHRESIAKMGKERREKEEEARLVKEREAARKNIQIREENKRRIDDREAAKELAKIQKEFEAESLRKKRQELKEIDEAERAIVQEERKHRIAQLQAMAERDRRRMKKKKDEHQREVEIAAAAVRDAQKKKVDSKKHNIEEIEHINHELNQDIQERIKAEHFRVLVEQKKAALKRHEELKAEEKRNQKVIDSFKQTRQEEASQAAEIRKAEYAAAQDAFLESKAKAKSLLQLQAKEQKARAKRAIAQEKAEKQKQIQEYHKLVRSLVERRVTSEMMQEKNKTLPPMKKKEEPKREEPKAPADPYAF